MRKRVQLPLLAFLALPRRGQVRRFIYASKDKYSMYEVSQGAKEGRNRTAKAHAVAWRQ